MRKGDKIRVPRSVGHRTKLSLAMLDKAIDGEHLAFKSFDRTQNVQDQLQEMMENEIGRIGMPFFWLTMLRDFCEEIGYPFTSMEQLWLAFVMKELYQKKWTGEDWIQ